MTTEPLRGWRGRACTLQGAIHSADWILILILKCLSACCIFMISTVSLRVWQCAPSGALSLWSCSSWLQFSVIFGHPVHTGRSRYQNTLRRKYLWEEVGRRRLARRQRSGFVFESGYWCYKHWDICDHISNVSVCLCVWVFGSVVHRPVFVWGLNKYLHCLQFPRALCWPEINGQQSFV